MRTIHSRTAWTCRMATLVGLLPLTMVAYADVGAVENGGDLEITGDSGADAVLIRPGGDDDAFVVKGLDNADGQPTLVNGQTQVTITDVDDDIQVNLGRGDDTVKLKGLTSPDRVRIETGAGDDVIVLRNAIVSDDLTTFGEDGDDTIKVIDSFVSGSSNLEAGDGDDQVRLVRSAFDDEVEIDLKDGNDALTLKQSLFEDDIQADGGDGNDRYRDRGGNSFDDDVDFDDFD